MLHVLYVAASPTPAPNSNVPLPSAASNLGTILFFFVVAGIVLIGFLMARSMRRVNANYAEGPEGTYIGPGSVPTGVSSDAPNEAKSEKSGKSSDS